MYARLNVFQAQPEKVDDLIAMVRDRVQPAVDAQPGSHGLGMWANRETGAGAVLTVWADLESVQASEPNVVSMRQQAAEVAGGEVEVAIFEPGVVEQRQSDQPGYWTRSVKTSVDPARVDDTVTYFRDNALPKILEISGVNTVSLMFNRETGTLWSSTTFESRAAMDAAADRARELRERATSAAGITILDVVESEVIIVGIRNPDDLPQQRARQDQPQTETAG